MMRYRSNRRFNNFRTWRKPRRKLSRQILVGDYNDDLGFVPSVGIHKVSGTLVGWLCVDNTDWESNMINTGIRINAPTAEYRIQDVNKFIKSELNTSEDVFFLRFLRDYNGTLYVSIDGSMISNADDLAPKSIALFTIESDKATITKTFKILDEPIETSLAITKINFNIPVIKRRGMILEKMKAFPIYSPDWFILSIAKEGTTTSYFIYDKVEKVIYSGQYNSREIMKHFTRNNSNLMPYAIQSTSTTEGTKLTLSNELRNVLNDIVPADKCVIEVKAPLNEDETVAEIKVIAAE